MSLKKSKHSPHSIGNETGFNTATYNEIVFVAQCRFVAINFFTAIATLCDKGMVSLTMTLYFTYTNEKYIMYMCKKFFFA